MAPIKHKINHLAYAKLFDHLLDVPSTVDDLVDISGLHRLTIGGLMRTLHQHNVVQIVGWEKDARGMDKIKVYGFGRGKDAKRERLSGSERMKAYRARVAMKRLADASAGATA